MRPRFAIGLCFALIVLPSAKLPELRADAANPPAIVVLGDSIAAGLGVDPAEAYPSLLQRKIDGRGWNFRVINAGVSGDTTAGGLARIDWVLRSRPAVLLIELGGNDGLRGIPPADTEKNLVNLIKKARDQVPGVQILLAGMQMPPNLGREFVAQFQSIFPKIARQLQVTLLPDFLAGVGGHPELMQPDHIHPTAQGHAILAEKIWRDLDPILARIRAQKSKLKDQ